MCVRHLNIYIYVKKRFNKDKHEIIYRENISIDGTLVFY